MGPVPTHVSCFGFPHRMVYSSIKVCHVQLSQLNLLQDELSDVCVEIFSDLSPEFSLFFSPDFVDDASGCTLRPPTLLPSKLRKPSMMLTTLCGYNLQTALMQSNRMRLSKWSSPLLSMISQYGNSSYESLGCKFS